MHVKKADKAVVKYTVVKYAVVKYTVVKYTVVKYIGHGRPGSGQIWTTSSKIPLAKPD